MWFVLWQQSYSSIESDEGMRDVDVESLSLLFCFFDFFLEELLCTVDAKFVERSRTFDEDSSGFSHDDWQWVMLIHCRTNDEFYFFYLLDRFDFKAEFSYKKDR